jgi:hypothetical protein
MYVHISAETWKFNNKIFTDSEKPFAVVACIGNFFALNLLFFSLSTLYPHPPDESISVIIDFVIFNTKNLHTNSCLSSLAWNDEVKLCGVTLIPLHPSFILCCCKCTQWSNCTRMTCTQYFILYLGSGGITSSNERERVVTDVIDKQCCEIISCLCHKL